MGNIEKLFATKPSQLDTNCHCAQYLHIAMQCRHRTLYAANPKHSWLWMHIRLEWKQKTIYSGQIKSILEK